jgi:hypothetical protein
MNSLLVSKQLDNHILVIIENAHRYRCRICTLVQISEMGFFLWQFHCIAVELSLMPRCGSDNSVRLQCGMGTNYDNLY